MQIYLQYMRAINQKQKIIEQFKETEDSRNCCQNKVDKVYFQHDMAYGDLGIYLEEQCPMKYYVIKYLTLLKIQNMMNIKNVLLQWFDFLKKNNFWIKICLMVVLNQNMLNQQLAEELHKPIIKKIEQRKL